MAKLRTRGSPTVRVLAGMLGGGIEPMVVDAGPTPVPKEYVSSEIAAMPRAPRTVAYARERVDPGASPTLGLLRRRYVIGSRRPDLTPVAEASPAAAALQEAVGGGTLAGEVAGASRMSRLIRAAEGLGGKLASMIPSAPKITMPKGALGKAALGAAAVLAALALARALSGRREELEPEVEEYRGLHSQEGISQAMEQLRQYQAGVAASDEVARRISDRIRALRAAP